MPRSTVLCIDIGATRAKAAIIKTHPTLAELNPSKVYVQRTLGWLNETLPQIVSGHWASLTRRISETFDCVAIAVPGPIINGQFMRDDLKVPKNLKREFEHQLPPTCEVRIVNDAEAWLRGSIQYLSLSTQEIVFPCMSLALGTGVGLARAVSVTGVEPIEISSLPNQFSNLANAAGRDIDSTWKVHGILGKGFFEWAEREHKSDWSYDKVRGEFTKRVLGFLRDVQSLPPYQNQIIKTYIFGGGNAEYVQKDTLERKEIGKIITLNNYTLTLNPDLISLLGLVSLYP